MASRIGVQRRNGGFALMLVLGVVLLAAAVIASMLALMKGRIQDLSIVLDRMSAYYLCEAGASVAVQELGTPNFVVGVQRSFNFRVGNQTYVIHYLIEKVSGQWQVTSSVDSPLGFNTRYTLRVGGQRAFPFFIKGPPVMGGI